MRIRLRVQSPKPGAQIVDLEAASETDAIRLATSYGMRVLSVEPLTKANSSSLRNRSPFPILLFSQELLALLEAGLNLNQALDTLFAKEMRPAVKELLGDILQALREGRNFSDTLAQRPEHFPDVYVATVRAAERTGDLPKALARYIAYQVQFEALRKKLISASIYPVMLLVVGSFVLLFLLGYVVPKFSVVYESSGRDLPKLSAMLLDFGSLIYTHWIICLTVFFTVVAAVSYVISQAESRKRLILYVLRIPVLARRAAEFRLARFYRAVGLLLASGIPLTRALSMVSGLLDQRQQQALALARSQVEAGQALSVALVQHGLAAPVAESLLKIGEGTGRLSDMMERISAFHDEDFSRWIEWASKLLEPTLMMMIGLIIGGVVVLMYIPIFELAGGLQ